MKESLDCCSRNSDTRLDPSYLHSKSVLVSDFHLWNNYTSWPAADKRANETRTTKSTMILRFVIRSIVPLEIFTDLHKCKGSTSWEELFYCSSKVLNHVQYRWLPHKSSLYFWGEPHEVAIAPCLVNNYQHFCDSWPTKMFDLFLIDKIPREFIHISGWKLTFYFGSF